MPIYSEGGVTRCPLIMGSRGARPSEPLFIVSTGLQPVSLLPCCCFEWIGAEFQDWAKRIAARFGYNVRFLPVGPEDPAVGSPTQMGVFERKP